MDPRRRDVERPIAVFKGRGWVVFAADPCFLFMVALGGTFIAAAFARFLPWPSALTGAPGLEGLVLIVGLAGFAALVVVQRWAVARRGQAELYADRLVIKQPRRFIMVRLHDVVAFDDRSGDYVRLSFVGDGWARPRSDVTVPTPDETGRAALVDALAAANVPRAEGQRPESRAVVASPTLLAVTGSSLVFAWSVVASLAVVGLLLASNAPLGPLVWTLVAVSLLAVVAIAAVWADPRTGAVRFDEDRIVIDRFVGAPADAWHLTLAWDDVIGWRDRSPDYLQLVLRPGLLRNEHGEPSVPTPTSEDRAAVEALLTARGVPRL